MDKYGTSGRGVNESAMRSRKNRDERLNMVEPAKNSDEGAKAEAGEFVRKRSGLLGASATASAAGFDPALFPFRNTGDDDAARIAAQQRTLSAAIQASSGATQPPLTIRIAEENRIDAEIQKRITAIKDAIAYLSEQKGSGHNSQPLNERDFEEISASMAAITARSGSAETYARTLKAAAEDFEAKSEKIKTNVPSSPLIDGLTKGGAQELGKIAIRALSNSDIWHWLANQFDELAHYAHDLFYLISKLW